MFTHTKKNASLSCRKLISISIISVFQILSRSLCSCVFFPHQIHYMDFKLFFFRFDGSTSCFFVLHSSFILHACKKEKGDRGREGWLGWMDEKNSWTRFFNDVISQYETIKRFDCSSIKWSNAKSIVFNKRIYCSAMTNVKKKRKTKFSHHHQRSF